jgi:propanol-preferring alcohol dehydrogenase
MLAMVLDKPHAALRPAEIDVPRLGPRQILIRVLACGVCRTDLHVVDGELPEPKLPLVPGHEIVGIVADRAPDARRFTTGQRVGVPWLGSTCGVCAPCCAGRENLCDTPKFTGYTLDGGYAQFAAADERYCFTLPDGYSDVEAAPLLCAGLIGYRSLVLAGHGKRLGIYGFGAAAHLIAQVAGFQGRKVFAFTRPGDREAQALASQLGAVWAGDSTSMPPEPLDAAIIYAPVGPLVPAALAATIKGGTVVCAGIHMSDIPSFPYRLLWGERVVRSVANLTRHDGEEFLALAPTVPLHVKTQVYRLGQANEALADLRAGRVTGAAVLVNGSAS